MTTTLKSPAATRAEKRRQNPIENGLPDPRPLTDYTVALSVVGGHSRLTVTLNQPCAIRTPNWALIDCVAGARIYPASVTMVSNTQFYFDYPALIAPSIAFVEVPFQDMQVQNF